MTINLAILGIVLSRVEFYRWFQNSQRINRFHEVLLEFQKICWSELVKRSRKFICVFLNDHDRKMSKIDVRRHIIKSIFNTGTLGLTLYFSLLSSHSSSNRTPHSSLFNTHLLFTFNSLRKPHFHCFFPTVHFSLFTPHFSFLTSHFTFITDSTLSHSLLHPILF